MLEEFIGENSENTTAVSLYLNCLANLSKFKEANNFVESLNTAMVNSEEINSALTNLKLKESNRTGPTIQEIENKLNKNKKIY